jgi:hypothetical protein
MTPRVSFRGFTIMTTFEEIHRIPLEIKYRADSPHITRVPPFNLKNHAQALHIYFD